MSYLIRPENPCKKDCQYRDTYCKLDCPDYKEYEEKYKQYSEVLNKKRSVEEALILHKKEVLNKNRKSRRR